MTRIKICGITNETDALVAIELGAHALGFITVEESPRYVTPARYQEILTSIQGSMGPFVTHVIVAKSVSHESLEYGPGCLQVYEDSENAPHYSGRLVRAFRIKDAYDVESASSFENADAVHLDTYHEKMLGGVGKAFDWELAANVRERAKRPVILAGGLTPDNVASALERVRPHAVDVSSGVESKPGTKDLGKLKAFFEAVREWDRAQDVAERR